MMEKDMLINGGDLIKQEEEEYGTEWTQSIEFRPHPQCLHY